MRIRKALAVVLLLVALVVGACGPAAVLKLEPIKTADGPEVTAVEGANGAHGGSPAGGDTVTIRGKNFPQAADCAVRFGEKRNKEKDLLKCDPTEIVVKV